MPTKVKKAKHEVITDKDVKPKTKPEKEVANKPKKKKRQKSDYTQIHKRLVLLYNCAQIQTCWQKAETDFANEFGRELDYPLAKYPTAKQEFEEWLDQRLLQEDKDPNAYLIKSELKSRGWDDRLLEILNVKPAKVIDLGRGRQVYYYLYEQINQLEDSPEFVEHIQAKIDRQRKRGAKKDAFGGEFVR